MNVRVMLVALVFPVTAAAGELSGIARYAPAQLQMAQQSLDRAREAALMGQASLAGSLAWGASVDARLAWGMSDSWAIRAPAAQVFREATRLVRQVAERQSRTAVAASPVEPAVP